ncbi:MAG TPA: hypothetical protein VMY80_03060 [Anaerolineae bacterium]|nr:hypothetical protein [Anaerolineae bacterium]
MIELGYVLRRAWEITWQHKVLWLLGFLVSLGTVGARLAAAASGRCQRLAQELPPEVQRALADWLSSSYFTATLAALAFLVLVVVLGLALLGALGRAALVDQVRAAEERGRANLPDGFRAGGRYLWPTFFIRLLLGLPVGAVALAGALPVVGTSFLVAGQERPEVIVPGAFGMLAALLACLLPATCLGVLLSAPVGVLQRLAVRACVLERLGVRPSILRAWTMLREHLGRLALVWLMLTGVGVGVLVVVGLPLVLAEMLLITAALLMAIASPALVFALLLVAGPGAWLVGAAVTSVVETFTSAVWTLVYREMTGLGLTGEEMLPAA